MTETECGTQNVERGTQNVEGGTTITIRVDHREEESEVVLYLKNAEVNIKIEQLDSADYILSEKIGIERKTDNDFLSSILDKRLFRQALSLRENFRNPVFIIEGRNLYNGNIHPNAVRGALSSLLTVYNVTVLQTEDALETALLMKMIAKQAQLGVKEITLQPKRKETTLDEIAEQILESIPGIGKVKAQKLLDCFGSIENVVNADVDTLITFGIFGEKEARRIKNIFKHEKVNGER